MSVRSMTVLQMPKQCTFKQYFYLFHTVKRTGIVDMTDGAIETLVSPWASSGTVSVPSQLPLSSKDSVYNDNFRYYHILFLLLDAWRSFIQRLVYLAFV